MRHVDAPSRERFADPRSRRPSLRPARRRGRPRRRRRGRRRTARDRESCRRWRSRRASRLAAPTTRALDSIPRDARPQLGEFVRRIAARQHVEHAVEGAAAQVGEWGGASDQRKQIVHRHVGGGRSVRADPARRAVRRLEPPRSFDGVLDMLSGRYPSDEFAELRPRVTWDRVARHARRTRGRQARGDRQRRHDSRSRPLRRVPRRRRSAGARRRARRRDGLRDAGRRDVHARRLDVAHRGDHARPRARVARARRAGQDAVLARRPGRAGRSSSATPSASWFASCARMPRAAAHRAPDARTTTSTPPPPRTCCATSTTRPRPARCPTTARSSSSAASTSSATGASACCRRSAAASTRRGRWRSTAQIRDAHRHRRRGDVGRRRLRRPVSGSRAARRIPRCCCPTRTRSKALVLRQLGSTSLFAARFRETAARALLLPRRRPGMRTPLWQQRKRAADLLAVASRFGSFPTLLETYRECCAITSTCRRWSTRCAGCRRARCASSTIDSKAPSPFAASLLFSYVANYIYDGDAPLAERRAQALSVDQAQLRELLGDAELRELLDPDALDAIERQLQHLDDEVSRAKPPTACTTCCFGSAICTLDEIAGAQRDADTRRRGRARSSARGAIVALPIAGERAVRRRRGRRAVSRRARHAAAAGPARVAARAGARSGRRSGAALRAVARRRSPRASSRARYGLGVAVAESLLRRLTGGGPADRRRVPSRRHASASGSTPTSCAASAGDRWRGCGRKSSRSTPTRSAGSCVAWHGIGSAATRPRGAARRHRAAAGRADCRVGARTRDPAGARRATISRRCSTR